MRCVCGVCTLLLLLIEAALAAATSLASFSSSYTRNPFFFFPCGYARRTSYGWRQCRPCCGPCCLTTRLRGASEQEVRFPSLSSSTPALLCTRRKQRILEFYFFSTMLEYFHCAILCRFRCLSIDFFSIFVLVLVFKVRWRSSRRWRSKLKWRKRQGGR